MVEQTQNALDGLPLELRTQIGEAVAGAPAERIDEIVYDVLASHLNLVTKEQLLGIDLKAYDQLRTYPTHDGTDWQRMRDRVAFLQDSRSHGDSMAADSSQNDSPVWPHTETNISAGLSAVGAPRLSASHL